MNQPEPFAQLLAKATHGPFARNSNAVDVTHNGHQKRLLLTLQHSQATDTAADAELITRLLNFAHSGGVELLEEMSKPYVSETDFEPMVNELKELLETLNNPSK